MNSIKFSWSSTVGLLFRLFFDSLFVVGISNSGDSKIGVPSNSPEIADDTVDAIGISFSSGLEKINNT